MKLILAILLSIILAILVYDFAQGANAELIWDEVLNTTAVI